MTMPLPFFDDVPPSFSHVSVMSAEVVRLLEPHPGGVYLDATAGGGGHSRAILEACPTARLVALDRDPQAVSAAEHCLADFGQRARVVHADFADVERIMLEAGITALDGLIADLGVSSQQLEDALRGMSFRSEGPLDMRMDPTRGETARSLIERLDSDELADVIYTLGEERRSRRVARCIKQALAQGELETTLDLRRAVVRAVGPRRVGGIDPATRTFQALRMAVNAELEQLTTLLAALPRLIAPGGVAVLLSFHSLEDRLVKRAFLNRESWQRLTPKPLGASDAELSQNPRARSAKLRAARRIDPSLDLEER
jgi:16S rRNA (cytosine1402-N4)-methyltransferase